MKIEELVPPLELCKKIPAGECKYFVEEKGYCRLLDMVDISYSEDACGVFEAKTDNDTQQEVEDV